jgi:murein DD-endopeptidase MepM/ murein hydrolase activator NlpD
MRHAAFLSRLGRGACRVLAASGAALALAGCSAGSRFDFPVFNLADTASADTNADPNATSSLPVPPESVYASEDWQGEGRIARRTLPPPAYSARPNAYTPVPSGRIKQAAYTGKGAPEAEPIVTRGGPPRGLHVKIAKGDTLSVLSRRYDVSVEEIMSANDLPDRRLHIGQDLVIPGAGGKTVEVAAAPTGPESTYKVAKGDTPHSIADKLGVDEKALLARNKLKANKLQIGQVLMVPGKGSQPAVAANEGKPATPKDAPDVHVVKTTTIPAPGTSLAEEESQPAGHGADGKSKKKPGASPGEVAASPEITGPSTPHVATNEQLPAPDPMSGNSFRWPVKGRVISAFGTKPDGGHNDGIDVAVPQGTSVMAAENGVVAYAGDELKGYGNLVLIRHANNWVSAYAHNDEILVKRGDKVRRGQVIAKAGASGSVSQPQVHFELRKGSRPVDPTKFMNAQAANTD